MLCLYFYTSMVVWGQNALLLCKRGHVLEKLVTFSTNERETVVVKTTKLC